MHFSVSDSHVVKNIYYLRVDNYLSYSNSVL